MQSTTYQSNFVLFAPRATLTFLVCQAEAKIASVSRQDTKHCKVSSLLILSVT